MPVQGDLPANLAANTGQVIVIGVETIIGLNVLHSLVGINLAANAGHVIIIRIETILGHNALFSLVVTNHAANTGRVIIIGIETIHGHSTLRNLVVRNNVLAFNTGTQLDAASFTADSWRDAHKNNYQSDHNLLWAGPGKASLISWQTGPVHDLAAWPEAPLVMDVVQSLIDQSLVRAQENADGLRFTMLVSVLAYATDKLKDPAGVSRSGSGPDAQRATEARHGEYFARFGGEQAQRERDRHGGHATRDAVAPSAGQLHRPLPDG